MFRYLKSGWLTILIAIVMAPGCDCAKKKVVVPTTMEQNVDMTLLLRNFRRQFTLVSDSGTLHGRILNFPDTVKAALIHLKPLEDWMHYVLGDSQAHLREILTLTNLGDEHGLSSGFYHHDFLAVCNDKLSKHQWDKKIPYDSLATLLIYAADGALGFYHDMRSGRVDPDYTGSVDALPRRNCGQIITLLGSDSLSEFLRQSVPDYEPYTGLQREYKRLLHFPKQNLGKQMVFNRKIRPGDSLETKDLAAIARKLRLHGFLNLEDSTMDKMHGYNQTLVRAVKAFQLKHELDPNGIIDNKTRELLNISRDQMLLRLRANLERWRWLGPVPENTKIWVNIAENRVYAFKQDTLKLEMNVCTGKGRDKTYYERLEKSREDEDVMPPDNLETPLMKVTMTHFMVNPSWFVPKNIMIKELLPQIKKNPGILEEKNYVLRNGKGEEVDPFSVNWRRVDKDNWKYRIEQLPCEENALGCVVIHFPNSYSIFMHDTPQENAFGFENRHVSHGCVRMEYPMKMVEFISEFQRKNNFDDVLIAAGMPPEKDEKKIKKYEQDIKDSLKAEKLKPVPNKYFRSDKKISVYLVYFTCAKNEMGGYSFYHDGYNRDEKLIQEMSKPRKGKTFPSKQTSKTRNEFSA